MDTPTPLFTAAELTEWLGVDVSPAKAETVERVVWGWLKPVLKASDRPNPVPDEVFSWAIELGAIAHENPSGLSVKTLGDAQYGYSAERRAEILELAGDTGASTTPPSPRGRFPGPRPYPDAAESRSPFRC